MCGAGNLFIRNIHELKLKKISTAPNSDTANISNIANISDISELKAKAESTASNASNIIETIAIEPGESAESINPADSIGGKGIKNIMSMNMNMNSRDNRESGGVKTMRGILTVSDSFNNTVNTARAVNADNGGSRALEYLYNRRYYILAISFIYVIGVIIGAALIKNTDKKDIAGLCSAIDGYFTGISSINMTARILGNIIMNAVFVFGIYICGITVFAPLICSAFCLYKGLACGFIIGVYIIGGGSNFHLAVCGLNFLLYLFTMMFFILTCAESMSFSSFLFKNDESFKDCMSFKNISVYSSRHLLFLALISLSAVVQTIAIPVVYSLAG